jgi:hypothetical protein
MTNSPNSSQVYDALIVELAPLDRPALIVRLTAIHPGLPLDFSRDFLNACDTERLRHLVLAAEWRCRLKSVQAHP